MPFDTYIIGLKLTNVTIISVIASKLFLVAHKSFPLKIPRSMWSGKYIGRKNRSEKRKRVFQTVRLYLNPRNKHFNAKSVLCITQAKQRRIVGCVGAAACSNLDAAAAAAPWRAIQPDQIAPNTLTTTINAHCHL